ncbi:matrixin family metalloprotease [Caenispirillum bisanense]|uniref:Matrixin n=1 Tax=Caenispirillum bisanense TaxID=414052 RepID=A0A286GU96_9PROT|nr:matrixin family metalloprotease [Caenispirillum bisanense]SOD98756.1 Matrixin [Caenispirillum bisanense]
MSQFTAPTTLAWATAPVRWSVASYTLLDSVLGYTYGGYPAFDRALTSQETGLVRLAFDAWATVSGISFQEVSDGTSTQIRLGVDAVDGPGNTLAHATYWWTGGTGAIAQAAVAFDSSDLATAWMGTAAPPNGQWSFYTTAVHEIGHAIGIGHLSDSQAIMYPYANATTTLTAADIAEAVLRYGAPAVTAPVTVAAPADAVPVARPTTAVAAVDAAFYLARNPDVAAAGIDAQTHYATTGWREGRDPVAWFVTRSYLDANPDVKAADVNPYAHFLDNGRHEGRDPNAWFDTSWYLSQYGDVAAAGINPVAHYWSNGWKENRDPSAGFDTSAYLGRNPDVAAAGMNPLEHWLLHGQAEGRALA